MRLEVVLTNAAGVSSIVSLWLYASSGALKRFEKQISLAGMAGLGLTFLCLSFSLVARGIDASRFPVANMYESLLLFAWGLLTAYILLVKRFKTNVLGILVSLLVSVVFLYASWLPPTQQEIRPLMPALLSNWRIIHVPPLIVSYAFLSIAGMSSFACLVVMKRTRTACGCAAALFVSLVSIWLGTKSSASPLMVQILFWGGSVLSLLLTTLFLYQEWANPLHTSDSEERLDELSWRCISLAFPLLTFGIITGAFWANHAWGAYWSWDPKESMSLVTWLFYALYLHLRAQAGDRTDLLSVLAVMGLQATLLTYLGFNFLGFGGLHSYGQLK